MTRDRMAFRTPLRPQGIGTAVIAPKPIPFPVSSSSSSRDANAQSMSSTRTMLPRGAAVTSCWRNTSSMLQWTVSEMA